MSRCRPATICVGHPLRSLVRGWRWQLAILGVWPMFCAVLGGSRFFAHNGTMVWVLCLAGWYTGMGVAGLGKWPNRVLTPGSGWLCGASDSRRWRSWCETALTRNRRPSMQTRRTPSPVPTCRAPSDMTSRETPKRCGIIEPMDDHPEIWQPLTGMPDAAAGWGNPRKGMWKIAPNNPRRSGRRRLPAALQRRTRSGRPRRLATVRSAGRAGYATGRDRRRDPWPDQACPDEIADHVRPAPIEASSHRRLGKPSFGLGFRYRHLGDWPAGPSPWE